MKRILASVLALAGISGPAHSQKVQTLDPKSILFTTPTLSNDLAQLEQVTRQPNDKDFIFHEDEWSQVEFLPQSRLGEVQRVLNELKAFELANRVQHGWRQVFVRRLERTPVIAGGSPIQQLESRLGVKAGAAPILFSANAISGQVKAGFSVPLGGNVSLYGYTASQGIPVLGAIIGKNPDDIKLTEAFVKLNASHKLVLVDWRAQVVLVAVSPAGQIEVWKP